MQQLDIDDHHHGALEDLEQFGSMRNVTSRWICPTAGTKRTMT